MASERPIIIPELLKELVYREIESSGIPKERASERSKLAQKCYLASLKLIKSHIVSGVKEPSLENPLEDLHELLLSRGRSAHVHKLNRLYDRLSNLSLSIPELNNHPQRILGAGPASQSRSQRNTFQDQFLRLLVPLFDTGSRDNDNQENFNNNIKVSNDLQNSISPVLSRFRDQSLQLASTSSCSIAEGGGGRGGGRLEAYSGESGQVASNDDYSVPLFVLEKCLLSPTQELALVHDILYALQGFDAQFVKYDVSTDSYILSPSVYSLETTRELVTEICHFGTIYKRMTKVLSYYRRELERPHLMERSMLTKTLVEFIQDLLSEYSQFIVSQQNEVQESMIALSKLDPGVNPNLELLSSSKPMLTLRRLLHRMDDQYHKREKVFAVLEGLLGQTSSSILSCLNVQRRNGNQHHEKIFESLFHKCVSVWIHDLNLILRYGTSIRYLDGIETKNMRTKTRVDFENRLGEFFIKGSLEEGIKVDESRIPNFLLLETAYQIAHLCKTRIMIRTLLAQDEDARLAEELEVFELSSETISDLNRIPLHSILNGLQDKLDTKLRDLVLGQGSLVSSLQGLRDSLVCFNGDFSDLLLRNLESELDKPSESVSLQNLEELFESTIRSCPWFNSIGAGKLRLGCVHTGSPSPRENLSRPGAHSGPPSEVQEDLQDGLEAQARYP
ncbi:gamma tubulin complex protein 3 [Cryptosporidium canis]|uniref:Gamma tubulin complex protein 3 n=1 Tax=Cryptosporidium canis TaxID=195482 RepID=A0ABQ8P6J7_9CRYT|nr:gamma tubulin complex protein 3 [Cryptosporidium canis]